MTAKLPQDRVLHASYVILIHCIFVFEDFSASPSSFVLISLSIKGCSLEKNVFLIRMVSASLFFVLNYCLYVFLFIHVSILWHVFQARVLAY